MYNDNMYNAINSYIVAESRISIIMFKIFLYIFIPSIIIAVFFTLYLLIFSKKNPFIFYIDINKINTPVGNTAPNVYMNSNSIASSTTFLYRSVSGIPYLSTDSKNNGGAFSEVISTGFYTAKTRVYYDRPECEISSKKQTSMLYTNLLNGGFFEYPSANPHHTTEMVIMMNTKTLQPGVTKYASKTSNSSNNFPTVWNYSEDGYHFFPITQNWLTEAAFAFDKDNPSCIIIGSISFNAKWNPNGKLDIFMNTPTITQTTKYLYNKKLENKFYISSNGSNFNEVNLSTGTIVPDITISLNIS